MNRLQMQVRAAIAAAVFSALTGGVARASGITTVDAAALVAERDIGAKSASGEHGIRLGEFRVRIYYPTEARKSALGFVCYATVEGENLDQFRKLFVHRRHKIRDQVIVATRRVPLADYDDAELTAFRRRILLRLRRMMPELMIEDIYISDFRMKVENM